MQQLPPKPVGSGIRASSPLLTTPFNMQSTQFTAGPLAPSVNNFFLSGPNALQDNVAEFQPRASTPIRGAAAPSEFM